MAQYDVYKSRTAGIYLLDVQSELLDGLATRIVVPLVDSDTDVVKIKRLHPVVSIGDRKFVVAAHLMAAVPKSDLKDPVANLIRNHDDIAKAVYMVFQGF